jgi:acetyl-CoA acyltransferase
VFALGDLLGAGGARVATMAVDELDRITGRYGLATMCIGAGRGIAVVQEGV